MKRGSHEVLTPSSRRPRLVQCIATEFALCSTAFLRRSGWHFMVFARRFQCTCATLLVYVLRFHGVLALRWRLVGKADMSRHMGKPTICIGENKGADQLRSHCKADQRLCFCYTDSTIPLLPKSKISCPYLPSVTVEPGLCRTWSEPKLLVFSRTGSYDVCLLCLLCLHIHVHK